jgi:Ca-activated chloride channel family protein
MPLCNRKGAAIGGVALLASALLSSCGTGRPGNRAAAPPPAAPATASADAPAPGDRYDRVPEKGFVAVSQSPLSTFSVDVDTASYSNVRRFLRDGQLPPRDAVRVEELLNYFAYDYPKPAGDAPFSVSTEVAACPWDADHRLLHVALKGRAPSDEATPAANLVFLVDTSGSMAADDKLPLLVQSLRVLVGQLAARDRVAIVTYAGESSVALESTPGDRRDVIEGALARLRAGGATNGGAGIVDAYRVAEDAFVEGATNRVVLATDGDFNLGVTGADALVRLVEEKRRGGVYLSVLGFGRGNLNDAALEALADHGNGNYAYVDSIEEGRKVLGRELAATLHTIAKDVKIQIEFDPARVAEYRLIGYEDRALADRDFNDDAKDAGEIGAGHAVTALYELVPAGARRTATTAGVDPLKYRQAPAPVAGGAAEIATVKLRYKEPAGDESKLMSTSVVDQGSGFDGASQEFRFATSVAEFGLLLRGSAAGTATYDDVLTLGRGATGADLEGQRGEFLLLVTRAKELSAGKPLAR